MTDRIDAFEAAMIRYVELAQSRFCRSFKDVIKGLSIVVDHAPT